jgi:hypothetical protein
MNNERDKEPEVFDRQLRNVCDHYADALHLHEEGVHLVSTDEKSGIQALERLHPALPMRALPTSEAASARSTSTSATEAGACSLIWK